jgi:hypothetical protein
MVAVVVASGKRGENIEITTPRAGAALARDPGVILALSKSAISQAQQRIPDAPRNSGPSHTARGNSRDRTVSTGSGGRPSVKPPRFSSTFPSGPLGEFCCQAWQFIAR